MTEYGFAGKRFDNKFANQFDKSVYHGVDKQTMKAWLRNQCSPQAGKHGYVIGPDTKGRLSHCSTHNTLAGAVQKAKHLNNESNTAEVFESSKDPNYSVSVFSDIRFGLRGAGYSMHRTETPETAMTPGDVDYLAGESVCHELQAIGNFVAWGK
jgi:hypothetical protein